ncbi:MAG: hypothetical protein ACTHNS_04175 [Marmoricola sp.]
MGKHSGERVEAPSVRPAALTAVAALLTVVAWVVLVTYAIRLGAVVRDGGRPAAWALLAVATVGAACCLFLGLVLGGRLIGRVRRPAPAQGNVHPHGELDGHLDRQLNGQLNAQPDDPAGVPPVVLPVRLPGGRRARR